MFGSQLFATEEIRRHRRHVILSFYGIYDKRFLNVIAVCKHRFDRVANVKPKIFGTQRLQLNFTCYYIWGKAALYQERDLIVT